VECDLYAGGVIKTVEQFHINEKYLLLFLFGQGRIVYIAEEVCAGI
jgi:hypothetical protein